MTTEEMAAQLTALLDELERRWSIAPNASLADMVDNCANLLDDMIDYYDLPPRDTEDDE